MRSFIDVPRKFYRRIYGIYHTRRPAQWVASYGILHCEVNIRKSPAKQFSEIAYNKRGDETQHIVSSPHEGFIM